MNAIYDALQVLPRAHLQVMWFKANADTPHGALLRYQIHETIHRRNEGAWKEPDMIGRGLIVIRREPDKNELHSVSPWDLSMGLHAATHGGPGNAPPFGLDEFHKRILQTAEAKKWPPEAIVTDAEVEIIRQASRGEGRHEYASDCIVIIEASNFAVPHQTELFEEFK